MSYHNTTHLSSNELARATAKALTQDEIVLQFFHSHPNTLFTPCEVHQLLINEGKISSMTPLTSIRRSITGLTDTNKITKTTHKKQGVYGKPNYTWVFRKEAVIMKLFE